MTALSGDKTPVTRPHFGWYKEGVSIEFVHCYRTLAQMIAHVQSSYGDGVSFCPEIENTRFTVWAKSRAATEAQLVLSAFMGCDDITLSLYDLDGGALSDEPAYGKMLKEMKPRLDGLVALDLLNAQPLGVAIPTSCDSGRRYRFQAGDRYDDMGGKKRGVESYLLKMGIPCYYITLENFENAELVALDGYTAGFLTDEELEILLRKKVFLDGGAVERLLARGFGEKIGVTGLERKKITVHSEIFCERKREDGTYIRISSRVPANRWYSARLKAGAKVLSNFLSPDGNLDPACVQFENDEGGMVVFYPVFNDWGDGFFTHRRVEFFKDIFGALSPSLPRVDCSGATLAVCREKDGTVYHLAINIASDTTETVGINKKAFDCKLPLYGGAVFKQTGEKIERIF